MERRKFLESWLYGVGYIATTMLGRLSKEITSVFDCPVDNLSKDINALLLHTPHTQTIDTDETLTNYWVGEISSTPTIRSMIFRDYIDKHSYYFTKCFQDQFGDLQERFIYKLLVDKLLQIFGKLRNSIGSKIMLVPTQAMFTDLVESTDWDRISLFAVRYWLDIPKVRTILTTKDDFEFTQRDQPFSQYWYEFMPYNLVYQKLLEYPFVSVMSSYKWITENGSSMHTFRTGLEIKKKTFDNLILFLDKFQVYSSQFGWASIVVRWAREFGHWYDRYFDHSKESFGKPLPTTPKKAYLDSHELWNCVDIRAVGKDGVVLYEYLRKHTQHKSIVYDTKHTLRQDALTFQFIYHGWDPMGGHFHCRMW